MRYCIYCGMPMEDDDVFCTRCGKSSPRGEAGPEAPTLVMPAESGPEAPMSADAPTPAMFAESDQEDMYYTEKRRPDSSRYVLIASAAILVAVLGILLFMLTRPSGEKKADQDQTVASYEDGHGSGGEKLDQGQAQPVVGQDGEAAQEDSADPDGNKDQSQAVTAGNKTDGNQPAGNAQAEDDEEDRGAQTQLVAGQGTPDTAPQSGMADEGIQGQRTGSSDDEESGWVTDEDGNEVYYPPDDAENTDSDQTVIGGGGESSGSDSSYVIPGSDTRYLTRQEIEPLDDYTLQMAINELYARHGRKFETESIRRFFEGKTWYHGTIDPADFDGNEGRYFNQYEMANRELMIGVRTEREQAAGTQAGM